MQSSPFVQPVTVVYLSVLLRPSYPGYSLSLGTAGIRYPNRIPPSHPALLGVSLKMWSENFRKITSKNVTMSEESRISQNCSYNSL